MNNLRPPYAWNFFDDEQSEDRKVKHVLRYDADPTKCYKDGRVQEVLNQIEMIGMSLRNYEEVKWKSLRKHTLSVFEQRFKDFQKELNKA
jgi:hypothetical protein